MVWKNERQRSVTFRKRLPRPPLSGVNLQGTPESSWRVLACTALIVPARGDRDHGPSNDWVVLVRDEILSQARQRLHRRGKATRSKNDDDRKQ